MITQNQLANLSEDDLLEYDSLTPDEQFAFSLGFRLGRQGPAEQYARKRSERAVMICQRDGSKDYGSALEQADQELNGQRI